MFPQSTIDVGLVATPSGSPFLEPGHDVSVQPQGDLLLDRPVEIGAAGVGPVQNLGNGRPTTTIRSRRLSYRWGFDRTTSIPAGIWTIWFRPPRSLSPFRGAALPRLCLSPNFGSAP